MESRARTLNVHTHASGIIVCRRSYTDIAMRRARIGRQNKRRKMGNADAPIVAKRNAVNNSTSTYCALILLLQKRHLPWSHIHEKTGMRSYQRISFPHDMHALLPESARTPPRKMRTFKKLPMMSPNKPKITANM